MPTAIMSAMVRKNTRTKPLYFFFKTFPPSISIVLLDDVITDDLIGATRLPNDVTASIIIGETRLLDDVIFTALNGGTAILNGVFATARICANGLLVLTSLILAIIAALSVLDEAFSKNTVSVTNDLDGFMMLLLSKSVDV